MVRRSGSRAAILLRNFSRAARAAPARPSADQALFSELCRNGPSHGIEAILDGFRIHRGGFSGPDEDTLAHRIEIRLESVGLASYVVAGLVNLVVAALIVSLEEPRALHPNRSPFHPGPFIVHLDQVRDHHAVEASIADRRVDLLRRKTSGVGQSLPTRLRGRVVAGKRLGECILEKPPHVVVLTDAHHQQAFEDRPFVTREAIVLRDGGRRPGGLRTRGN